MFKVNKKDTKTIPMASDLAHCFGVSTVDFEHVNADKVVTNFCENTPQKIKFSINNFYSKCD